MMTLEQLGDIVTKEIDRIHQLPISDQEKLELVIEYLQLKIREVNGSIPTADEADVIEDIDKYIFVSTTLTLLYNYQQELQDEFITQAITNLN